MKSDDAASIFLSIYFFRFFFFVGGAHFYTYLLHVHNTSKCRAHNVVVVVSVM